jgi:hypothetical protein
MTTQQIRNFSKRFEKQFGRKLGKTSLQYIEDGALTEVFKRDKKANTKQGLTIWGYEKVERVTKSVLRSRAAFMRECIAEDYWTGRKLRFAKHHLNMILRAIENF